MASVTITTNKPDFSMEEQLREVRVFIAGDVRHAYDEAVRAGFPSNPKDYALFVTTRGRTSRRQLSTISPAYITIGSQASPTVFEFQSKGGFTDVVAAANMAWNMLQARAPFRTGQYRSSLVSFSGGKYVEPSSLNPDKMEEGDQVILSDLAPYASIIEAGFYTGKFKTQSLKQGIFYFTAKAVAEAYAGKAAVKFDYVVGVGGAGTIPAITIAPYGSFLNSFAIPGSEAKKKRRKAAARARRHAARSARK